jgi:hypothetical protein
MAPTVWLGMATLKYPYGGGFLWTYLNWALSLRSAGCDVVWMEADEGCFPPAGLRWRLAGLRHRLAPFGLGDSVALWSKRPEALSSADEDGCVPLDAMGEADLLLNTGYDALNGARPLFRRTALLDIDPGLTQVWASEGCWDISGYDAYFTVGETVGQPDACFPSGGFQWRHVPPPVALEWWPVMHARRGAPFTTVSHWRSSREWFTFGDESFPNDKRSGFLPVLDLPTRTEQPLELALGLAVDGDLRLKRDEAAEKASLERLGWRVVHSRVVAATPSEYQVYIRSSKGEFSAAKPSCVRLQNAWISDRTVCYLASGKPAVVEWTGPSRLLPRDAGMFRFRNVDEAARALDAVAADYERHSRLARALAEEVFDGRRVAARLLAHALA